MSKSEALFRDLRQKMKELGWAFDRVNSSTGHGHPAKKRIQDLFRELVLNDPEYTFQEKIHNQVRNAPEFSNDRSKFEIVRSNIFRIFQ